MGFPKSPPTLFKMVLSPRLVGLEVAVVEGSLGLGQDITEVHRADLLKVKLFIPQMQQGQGAFL